MEPLTLRQELNKMPSIKAMDPLFRIRRHRLPVRMKAELDDIEKKLAVEDSFIAYCTKGNPRNGSDESTSSASVNDESDSSRLEGCDSNEILVDSPNATKTRKLNDEDLGITNLYVSGEVLAVKLSTLCSDPASKLAQNLSDKNGVLPVGRFFSIGFCPPVGGATVPGEGEVCCFSNDQKCMQH